MRLTTRALGLVVLAAATALPATALAAEGASFLLAYQLRPGESLRYKLTADLKGSLPIMDNPTPIPMTAVIRLVYRATPKTRLPDGAADVVLKVESAELELGTGTDRIPFPIPLEQVEDVLNQTVTMRKTGEVTRVADTKPLPFSLSIPGVDPKRLYSLLFPIVFQAVPVRPGDAWDFRSELLGGEGADPKFTATLLPLETPRRGQTLRLGEKFAMDVDQKLDAERKPVSGDTVVYRTRKGRIEGDGIVRFDQTRGLFTSGVVNIHANVVEDLLGKPEHEDDPRQIVSTVDAKVTVQLQPSAAPRPARPRSKERP